MAQVEFVETPSRLAGGWRIGTQPHSRARACARCGNDNTPNGKLGVEAPPERTSSPLAPLSPPYPAPFKALLLQAPGTLFGPLSLAIDIFVHLTFCSASGFPHTVALSRACASRQCRPCRVTRLRAYHPRTRRGAPARMRRTECAQDAEADVFVLVDLDLVCLFNMR